MSAELGEIIRLLVKNDVRCILIGGMAGMLHGAARVTFDVDVVYERTKENHRRIILALKPFAPSLRGAPPGLPFLWDEKTLQGGLNFTLTTTLGDVVLLAEVAGDHHYEELLPHSELVNAFGVSLCCLNLKKLIEIKKEAGRKKDLEAIAELDLLLREIECNKAGDKPPGGKR